MADPAARRRARRRLALGLLGSALVLAALATVLPFDELVGAWRRIPPRLALWIVPAYLALHLLGVVKWRLLVDAANGGLGLTAAARCHYAGLFGNAFLPSLVGGDAVRAGLAIRLARDTSGVVFGSLLDRLLDVAGLATLAGAGLLLAPTALPAEQQRLFRLLLVLALAAATIAAIVVAALPARRLPFRLRRFAVRLRRSLRALRRRPGRVAIAFGLGLTLQSALVVLNARLGRACGIDVPLAAWLFAWPLAKLSALVPLTQGGIGVREAALAALLAPFGVAAPLAVATGLAFQGVLLTGSLSSGGIAFALGRLPAARLARPG